MNDEELVDKRVSIVILLIIIIIGMFGNTLNLLVLGKKSMRKITTFRFLLYLSIIDLLVLVVCVSDVLLKFGFDNEIRLSSLAACKLHTFFTYYLTHLSSVVLMVVSIERLIVVCKRQSTKKKLDKLEEKKSYFLISIQRINDHLTKKLQSKKRVELILALLMTIVFLINVHYLIFLDINYVSYYIHPHESDENTTTKFQRTTHTITHDKYSRLIHESLTYRKINVNISAPPPIDLAYMMNSAPRHDTADMCFPLDGSIYYYFLAHVWLFIDVTTYCFIPFFIMFICTVVILVKIRRNTDKFNKSFAESNILLSEKRARKNNQMFLMLTVTNLFFISCSLPYCILFYKLNNGEEVNPKFSFLVHVLAYSNNSLNFVFYGLFSQKYRKEMAKMFTRRGRRASKWDVKKKMSICSKMLENKFKTESTTSVFSRSVSNVELIHDSRHRSIDRENHLETSFVTRRDTLSASLTDLSKSTCLIETVHSNNRHLSYKTFHD